VTASIDWDQLNQLTEGAKVAIGDRIIVFGPDQISLVRTLIDKVKGLTP
jgi:hypothetical protein